MKNATDNPIRRIAGKLAKRAGSDFEGRLAKQHDLYERAGMAKVCKLSPETAGNPKRLRYISRAPVDFAGVISGGRAVFIEAKSTGLLPSGNPAGTLGIRHGELNVEQVAELVKRARLGALALVLWWNGRQCGVFPVTVAWFNAGVGTGIKADAFTWLEGDSVDWLSVQGKGGAL